MKDIAEVLVGLVSIRGIVCTTMWVAGDSTIANLARTENNNYIMLIDDVLYAYSV